MGALRRLGEHVPLLGALAGAAAFFVFLDHRLLDPGYLEWTLRGDAAQHFLGWHFFRREPWTLPPGLIRLYPYPEGTSLVFTDSIPLIAIPLKIFSPVLPDPFQYHGAWLALCYVLQGYFSCLLLKRVTGGSGLALIGTSFFLMVPTLLDRTGSQEALAAHWVILASLNLYVSPDTAHNRIKWAVLLVVTSMIHFYFLFMVFMMWSGFLLKVLLKDFNKRNLGKLLRFSVAVLSILVFAMWLAGYFTHSFEDTAAGGFGHYSMNLLSPINPMPFEEFTFLDPAPMATTGQYEGFNYLGAGLLFLILTAIFELFRHGELVNARRDLPLLAVALILFALALSNNITWAQRVVLHIPLSDSLADIFGVLRSSGRLFWPVAYMLTAFAIAIVARCHRLHRAMALLLAAVVIQVVDFAPYYKAVGEVYARMTWASLLQSDAWNDLIPSYSHVAFVPPERNGDDYVPFALLAASHGTTLNVASVARLRTEARRAYRERLLKAFERGSISKDTLYVMRSSFYYEPHFDGKRVTGTLDGFPILAPGAELPLPGLQPWPFRLVADHHEYSAAELMAAHTRSHSVLIAVKDEATSRLPGDFAALMEKAGSRIRELEYRGSYAAIVRNGELLTEAIDNHGEVEIERRLGERQIRLRSAGLPFGNVAQISIDGIDLAPDQRGLNVVVLNEEAGEVKRFWFDTHGLENPEASGLLIDP